MSAAQVWRYEHSPHPMVYVDSDWPQGKTTIAMVNNVGVDGADADINGPLIVALHNALPDLCAKAKALRGTVVEPCSSSQCRCGVGQDELDALLAAVEGLAKP